MLRSLSKLPLHWPSGLEQLLDNKFVLLKNKVKRNKLNGQKII
jgi:hypothetical protein